MQNLLIALEHQSPTPLYLQIYRHITGEIQAGRVRADQRLPSKRTLRAQLGVSLSTVEAAYGMLCDEGYLEARPKRGYFVRDVLPLPAPQGPPPAAPAEGEAEAPGAGGWDFSTGAVDTSRFPYATWAKITKETVYQCPHLLQRGEGRGDRGLREALAGFLYESRGVCCRPDQIVVGAGAEYLADLLLSLLGPGGPVALEDPGYPVLWSTAQSRGFEVAPVPVGPDGVDLLALAQSGARAVFVTPSHQFPLGVTMPAGRRSRLLAWAAEGPGRYIVEDDYDSEFRYTTRPIPSLQGMDQNGRVVYMGTFSRGLAPSIRVAYMVLPDSLSERYARRESFAASTVSRLEQETLRRFIAGGHYARHLRRMNNFYGQKRQRLTARLAEIPGVGLSGDQAGLHFLLAHSRLSEGQLIARAAARGIALRGLGRYCHRCPAPPGTLVLGFAGLRPEQIDPAARALAEAWR